MCSIRQLGGDIILDVSRYEEASVKDMYGSPGDTESRIDRWVLPMSGTAKEAREERMFAPPLHFPKISSAVEGRAYRYGYTVEAPLDLCRFPRRWGKDGQVWANTWVVADRIRALLLLFQR